MCWGRGGVVPAVRTAHNTSPQNYTFLWFKIKTKRNARRRSFSLAWVSDGPSLLRVGGAALPRVSSSFPFGEGPLRRAARSASKFPFAHRPAWRPRPATCAHLCGTPKPGTGTRRMVHRDSGFAEIFFQTKSLSGSPPAPPGPAPPSLHAHAAPPRHTRCEVPLPPDNGFGAGQAAGLAPSRDPERAGRGGLEGGRTEARRERPQWGRWAPPPRDRRLAPGARKRGGGGGSAAPPGPGLQGPASGRRRALTSTIANRSSSSPGSGIGSFKGTLCPLKSVCCESMLPALPILAARRGRGLLRAPSVRVGNQKSSRWPAPAGWRDLPGSPPSAAPRRVCSARRSLAALRVEPPPGLPHAPRRPSAAPASFPREGSSGRRAPICMLLRWHAAPCQQSRPVGAWFLQLGLPPGPRPPLTLPAHGRPKERSLGEHLQQTNAGPRSRHNAPSRPAPAPGPAPPTRPADCRDA